MNYILPLIDITYVDNLEIPFITKASVRAVKKWLVAMQKQDVLIDFTSQTAADFHPADTNDCDIDPQKEFTFDQCGFINGQLELAKDICDKFGYRFSRALGYFPASDDYFLEVYPMIKIDQDEATLCTREHHRNPDFYDVLLRGGTLEFSYYELENIDPRHINKVIHAACKRFGCDYETVEV